MAILYGTNLSDPLTGTAGNDQIFGWLQANLPGDEGPVTDADTLFGGAGNDTLHGGAGNDTLFGGTGNDSLIGGAGVDQVEVNLATGTDRADGGIGNDVLVLDASGVAFGVTLTLVNPAALQTLTGGAVVQGFEQLSFYGGSGVDTVTGGALDDLIRGGVGDDVLTGGAGIDTLEGGEGNDQLFGGAGAGRLFGGAGNDTVEGADDYDQIEGGDGNDLLSGGGNIDTLDGGAGNDTLYGGQGDDKFIAGLGNDTLFGDAGNDDFNSRSDSGKDNINGGFGTDRLILDRDGTTLGLTMSLATPNVSQLLADGTRFVNIELLNFYGGSGSDSVQGGATIDLLYSGDGNDTLLGEGGTDALRGDGGNDSLNGGTADDDLSGGTGNDILRGGSENDLIRGDAGNDEVYGDSGADRIIHWAPDGVDIIDGGAGNDSLLYESNITTGLILTIANPAVQQILADGSRFVNIEQIDAYGGVGSDNFTGGALLDNLFGGQGNDTLNGGAGNDSLDGGGGNDRLDGGLGVDNMIGSGGNDTYIVDNAMDFVNEANFDPGIDIVFSAVNFSLDSTAIGAHVSGEVENLILTGTAVTGVGSAGANVIFGNALANTLTGGAGMDAFVFRSALGTVDQITDYSVAQDTVRLDNAVFTMLNLGALTAAEFHIGAAAADASDRIVYNSATGALIYDTNGTGAGGATQFATLSTGLALTAADILVY
jgi:serralysin